MAQPRRHGNAYAVGSRTASCISRSRRSIIRATTRIAIPAGRPATYWTPKIRVKPSQVTSAVLPRGDRGGHRSHRDRYMGSEELHRSVDNCADAAHWNTTLSVLTDALSITRGGPTTILAGKVNHRVDHRGQSALSGTTCTGDRSLWTCSTSATTTGRIGRVHGQQQRLAAEPRTTSEAGPSRSRKEVAGPSLLAPTVNGTSSISISIPQNGRADAAWRRGRGRTPRCGEPAIA